MARIFSIQFDHNNTLQNAMVYVRETPLHTEYKLTTLDIDLMDLLPSNKIVSPTPDTFYFANSLIKDYTALMKEIIYAISQHIHSVQY
jgi:hypothetical protein